MFQLIFNFKTLNCARLGKFSIICLSVNKRKMLSGSKRTASSATKLSTPAKKSKNFDASTSTNDFAKEIQKKREDTADSISDYKFNKKRLRIISQEQMVLEDCEGIVYWMSRDSRVQDNWAFLYAQHLALKNVVPLHVCFCLIAKYLDASVRQFHFLIKGKTLEYYH